MEPGAEGCTGRNTVAVIGGGFSGLMTALHLVAREDGPAVLLIDRSTSFGRGPAYATDNPEHLLNVRAGNMSAWPDRPDDFADWLVANRIQPSAGGFATRASYGAYLQTLLQEGLSRSAPGRLTLVPDEAVAVEAQGTGWRVRLRAGQAMAADAVVLALGNLPPAAPGEVAEAALSSHAYVADPWAIRTEDLPEQGVAFLIGTGLTMVDVALTLSRARPGLHILAVSRHGLLPRRQLADGPPPLPAAAPPDLPLSGLLRAFRREAHTHDWRSVLDGLRPHAQTIWRGWRVEQERRFLRHLRPWWEVHRHRVAPAVSSRLDHLTGAGLLSVAAGRIRAIEPEGDGLSVVWAPRHGGDLRRTRAAMVVNCTGPAADLARAGDPLVSQMFAQGLIRPDPCRIGLQVDKENRLVGADGVAHPTLFAVGAPTRGALWEITSVPYIRSQAPACAEAATLSVLASARVGEAGFRA